MIKTYFNNIQEKISNEIVIATSNIKVAVCWFTSKELFDLLCNKLEDGTSVELIVLNDSINNRPDGLHFQKFIDLGGKFYYSSVENPMHNKYCIIDETIVLNGSYNWTYFAENKNFENVMIFKDDKCVIDFTNDFNRLKQHCKLVTDITADAITEVQDLTIIENAKFAADTDIIINNRVEIGNAQLTLNATLGESIYNDVYFPFIPKGSKIPISNTYTLTTSSDNQVVCHTDIRFGENKVGSTNTQIGTFSITNIPPLPKASAGLITTFSIDEYGILTVAVKVRETGNLTLHKFDIKHLVTSNETS
jgi:hypothetical protein